MKILSRVLVVLIMLLLIAIGLGYYVFNTKIKQQILPSAKSYIQEQTKLKVDFKDFRLSLSQLLKLDPSIKVTELTVEDALKVKTLLIKMSLRDLLRRKVTINQILIDEAELILVENSEKVVYPRGINPSKLSLNHAATGTKSDQVSSNILESLELKQLELKNSRLVFFPHGAAKPIEFDPVRLELNDLGISKEKNIKAHYKLSAYVLNSNRSKVFAEGELGPVDFDFKSVPLEGKQNLDFYLADISEAERKVLFGDLVLVKNNTAVHQESKFAGDLMATIKGSGNLKTEKLAVGNSEQHKLDVLADMPHSYSLRLIRKPLLKLESRKASVQLVSKDRDTGALEFDTFIQQELDTGLLQGSSRGRLSGLELQDVLNSMTEFRDLISGNFSLDDYQVFFKGNNADQINRSLKASGFIQVSNGSLYILKSLTKYKDLASSLLGVKPGAELEKLSGDFSELSTGFEFKNGNLITEPILLKTDALTITGSGRIIQGQDLDYQLSLNAPHVGQVPLGIRGTIKKPRVYPDMAKLGQQQGERILNNALKLGLDALMKNAK